MVASGTEPPQVFAFRTDPVLANATESTAPVVVRLVPTPGAAAGACASAIDSETLDPGTVLPR